MVVRPVSVVVISRPVQPGPMDLGRTRIPAIVITDVYVGTALKNYISQYGILKVQNTPRKNCGVYFIVLCMCVRQNIYFKLNPPFQPVRPPSRRFMFKDTLNLSMDFSIPNPYSA